MIKKTLGKSNLEITRIGLGAWAIGGPWQWGWSDQDDTDSIKTIHKALDMGINWIDTAAIYGLGHSEEIVGKAIKDLPIKPLIFTKCGLIWDSDKNISNSIKKESIEKEINDSLRRLDIDIIDLYQIHWPNPNQEIEEAWETLAELKEKQKVRYIGISNFSVEHIKRAEKIHPITSNQPPYSLLNRHVEKNVLPYCEQNNIGTINYSPMAAGLLSGKMTRERVDNLPSDDWRNNNNEFKEPALSKNLSLVEILKEIGNEHSCTAGEVAIAWTLLNPAVTGAIVGMRRPDQVEGVIKSGEIELTKENVKTLEDFVNADYKL
jgi:aryl-alcohol dehydrogenase-like predicted oxidoreductase